MSNFSFLHSAILRGVWLIDKSFADSQMPVVLRLAQGEAVDFDFRTGKQARQMNDEKIIDLPVAHVEVGMSANVYTAGRYTDVASLPEGSILVYSMSGPMVKNGGMCAYGMVDHANAINKFGNSPNVGGIILSIDSPGGQASGTAMLADVIKNVAGNKPVIAMIDDGMAASAAMWIASAANEIYTTQATDQVGSIGVYTTIADWKAHYRDKLKLPVMDVYAPQSTDKNGGYRSAIEGDTTALEEDLSVLANQFINTVATNRGSRVKGDGWKTGKMFYSADAQKQGLIDGTKNFSGIVDRMNTLITQRKKSSSKSSNNMAFEKALVAAKATAFTVVDGGFRLTEDNLNNLEANIAAGEKATAELEKANASVKALTDKVASLEAAAKDAAAATDKANATIKELEGKVAELGKQPSGKGTTVTTAADAKTGNSTEKQERKFAGDELFDAQQDKKGKTDYSKLKMA